MRAAFYERNGPAEVLELGDMPRPEPAPGEVLVRLAASGVNPSDVKTRAGSSRTIAFPRVIPHSDGAGIVEAVGPGVPESRIGEKVWLYNAAWQRAFGTAAEYCALPASLAVTLPPQLGFAEGACLGIPVMTAHRAVFADGGVTAQTVLVSGGAGVVGHYAVQLAKWGGARVIATVSSEAKAAHARAGGADETIDYRREDVAARVLEITEGEGVDRIVEVEFGGNLPINDRILKMGGVIATYGSVIREPTLPFFRYVTRNAVIRLVHMYGMPEDAKRQAADDIAAWARTGRAQFAIAARFPLDATAAAHREVEAAVKIGHVVLEIAS